MITATARRAPTAQEANLLCARLPFIPRNDVTALQRAALALGMQQVGTNAYRHPSDGSWAYMDPQGMVQRGVGNTMFQGIPRAAPAAPAAPPVPVAPPLAPAVTRSTALPPIPASMKTYKIATMGFVTLANFTTLVAADVEFVRVDASTWVHGDGTWVTNANGRVTVGWNGHPLSALPYKNGSGWW